MTLLLGTGVATFFFFQLSPRIYRHKRPCLHRIRVVKIDAVEAYVYSTASVIYLFKIY